jgi:hypothetical protein
VTHRSLVGLVRNALFFHGLCHSIHWSQERATLAWPAPAGISAVPATRILAVSHPDSGRRMLVGPRQRGHRIRPTVAALPDAPSVARYQQDRRHVLHFLVTLFMHHLDALVLPARPRLAARRVAVSQRTTPGILSAPSRSSGAHEKNAGKRDAAGRTARCPR